MMEKSSDRNPMIKFLLDWVVPIGAAILLAMLINKFLLYKVSVPTESMYPTIKKGDQMFVTKIYNPQNIKRGDILVFYSNELKDLLIKRVVGLPGETVEVKDNGDVYVNGKYLEEDYVKNPDSKTGNFKIPEGKYLMLGDNRANSADARYWNNPYIDAKDIQGKARVRVFPFDRIGLLK